MSWIRVDVDVHENAKCLTLGVLLGEKYADRYWVDLLRWCGKHKVDGNLAGLPDEVIASAARYDGKAKRFVAALRDANLLSKDGVVVGWEDYQGALIRRREADKERKATGRANPAKR